MIYNKELDLFFLQTVNYVMKRMKCRYSVIIYYEKYNGVFRIYREKVGRAIFNSYEFNRENFSKRIRNHKENAFYDEKAMKRYLFKAVKDLIGMFSFAQDLLKIATILSDFCIRCYNSNSLNLVPQAVKYAEYLCTREFFKTIHHHSQRSNILSIAHQLLKYKQHKKRHYSTPEKVRKRAEKVKGTESVSAKQINKILESRGKSYINNAFLPTKEKLKDPNSFLDGAKDLSKTDRLAIPGSSKVDPLAIPGSSKIDSLAMPGSSKTDPLTIPGSSKTDPLAIPGSSKIDPQNVQKIVLSRSITYQDIHSNTDRYSTGLKISYKKGEKKSNVPECKTYSSEHSSNAKRKNSNFSPENTSNYSENLKKVPSNQKEVDSNDEEKSKVRKIYNSSPVTEKSDSYDETKEKACNNNTSPKTMSAAMTLLEYQKKDVKF